MSTLTISMPDGVREMVERVAAARGETVDTVMLDAWAVYAEREVSPLLLQQRPPAGQTALARRLEQHVSRLSESLDDDEVPPSPAAAAECGRALQAMAAASPDTLFVWPHVSTLGGGDLVCEWRGAGRDLLLLVSPAGDLRIVRVHRDPDAPSQAALAPDDAELLAALRWLLGK